MKQGILVLLLFWLAAPHADEGTVIFRDDFDDEFISESWEVENPDPDAALVEEGMLQILTQVPQEKLFNAKNLLLYKGELPKEYEVRMGLSLTQAEWCKDWWKAPFVGLVLKRDGDNAIAFVAGHGPGCRSSDGLNFLRVENGSWKPAFSKHLGEPKKERPVVIRLVRRGRLFEGYVQKKDAQGRPHWDNLGVIPLINVDGYRLGIIAARGSGDTREQLEMVDWFELRELNR